MLGRLRERGVLLTAVHSADKPYCGVLTGLNEAFLIDDATRDRPGARRIPACADTHQTLFARAGHRAVAPRLARIVDDRARLQRQPRLALERERAIRRKPLFARTYPSLYNHMQNLTGTAGRPP